jgi:hypothetical protein
MSELFRISTDRVFLTWSGPALNQSVLNPPDSVSGRLAITPRRPGLNFGDVNWRAGVPAEVADNPELLVGPRLFEETAYTILARSRDGSRVSIKHRDPNLLRSLTESEGGQLLHGAVDFRSQVGRSVFTVGVGGKPELDFEVEVFPSKLDYETDYQALTAEVQELLTGLVVEYLRSTYQRGDATPSDAPPTHVEWLTLLRAMSDDLGKALTLISAQPMRGLKRTAAPVRASKLRRADSSVRHAVARGRGTGGFRRLDNGIAVRARLTESRPQSTLDIAEHRWFAAQLRNIQQRLAQIRREEVKRRQRYDTGPSERVLAIDAELAALQGQVSLWLRLPPIEAATARPPAGFASLALLTRPGYREAYRSCMALALGLRLTGGPVQLSVKDLHELYEYWCYLALLRIVGNASGEDIEPSDLLAVEQHGLRVRVQKGRQHQVHFVSDDRLLTVTYNPLFSGAGYLLPQQPDLLITVEQDDWPPAHLVLDAKYRVDSSPRYVQRYGSPGPPDDALNVLHRYRDAILDLHGDGSGRVEAKRTVVEGAALFPLHPPQPEKYKASRLYESLERLGIGALPFLPGEEGFVDEWVRGALSRGGWATADRAPAHVLRDSLRDWRSAASEAVLVGVLRGEDPEQHLEWIRENRLYYAPLTPTQKRQFAAKWVALYLPTALRSPGAVTCSAPVEEVTVVRGSKLQTPWHSRRREADRQYVLYHLGEMRDLTAPILNQSASGRATRFSGNRWTSLLALRRAKELRELFLETEPEWRLLELLRGERLDYELQPGVVRLQDLDDPAGRAWFKTVGGKVQYGGAAGFRVLIGGTESWVARAEDVIGAIGGRQQGELGI